MESILNRLNLQRIDIRFFPNNPVEMNFWIGAVLRNRFLYAADKVICKQGISLRQLIETLPLQEEHFLYKQLRGGFPKGFLFDCSRLPYNAPGFILEADRIYTFSLILIGKNIVYKTLFIEAIQLMLNEGFGHPIVPMTIVDIAEKDISGFHSPSIEQEQIKLELLFRTPVCLLHSPKEESNGFQNKLNNFPSFYQFMRSLAYRVITLGILYANGTEIESRKQMDEMIEQYIRPSAYALLLKADLHYEKRYSSPKKEEKKVYSMSGYTGKLVFGQVYANYFALLTFASELGVGSDINYGLGNFQVRRK